MELMVISFRLHDGHLLCELINKVHEGAISEKVYFSWCDKVTIYVLTNRNYRGAKIPCPG